MTEQEIRADMDVAAKQDRERFFKVADTLHLQPKYAAHLSELETLKQGFRNMTALPDYPNIDWPPALPEWFPAVHFASGWEKDVYIESLLPQDESGNEITVTAH